MEKRVVYIQKFLFSLVFFSSFFLTQFVFSQEELSSKSPEILNNSIVQDNSSDCTHEFTLSLAEQEFIQRMKPLTVAANNRWHPYEFYNLRTKKFTGYTVDLFTEISAITGLEFEFIYENKNIESTADIIGIFGNLKDFAEKMGYRITDPYLALPFVIVYKDNLDLANGKTALTEGSALTLDDFHVETNQEPVFYKDQAACLKAVYKGEVNQTIMNTFSANYEIQNNWRYSNLNTKIIHNVHLELCSLIKEDLDPNLFPILNKCLQYISNTYSDIFIIQNTYKTSEITLLRILNKMPLDVILVFTILLFLLAITISLNWSKASKRKIILQKNRQLQDALISEQRANAAKTQFTSRISHEIRTPLNAVIGYITIAKTQKCQNSLIFDFLEKAEIAAKQLLTLINDVLDLSSIESGKIHLIAKPFNLKEFIKTLSNLFYHQAKTAGISFQVNTKTIKNEIIIGDQLRLTQILNNILSNAIKFTPAGGAIHFTITEEKNNDTQILFTFKIKDTGIGIDPQCIETIFNPYEQLENNSKPELKGSGLGLSIAKNLVSLLNGAITVESEINKGSTFTITLPFGIKDVKIEPHEEHFNKSNINELFEAKKLSQVQQENATIQYEGKKILLVEDNDMNLEIATELLKNYNIKVVSAKNGQEAYDLFTETKDSQFDLILMDIQMPIMDGYEATKKIRESRSSYAKDIPIVAMTANAFAEDISLSLASGMNDHLSKPIDVTELLQVLTKYLS